MQCHSIKGGGNLALDNTVKSKRTLSTNKEITNSLATKNKNDMKTDKEMILEMFAKGVEVCIQKISGKICTYTNGCYELEFENILDAHKFHCSETPVSKYFSIDGYFKDDNSEFNGYIVKEFSDVDESEDDRIFYYGLSEKSIRDIMENGSELDFAITSCSEIEKCW